jgi:HK97 family phage prohead protease
MQNYVELHRLAAIRLELLNHPQIALRLTLAHMIVGSSLWMIKPEPMKPAKPEIGASVAANPATTYFEERLRELLTLVHRRLPLQRGLGNLVLGPAGGDGFRHAAHLFHLLNQRPGLVGELLREVFNIVRARQRIDHISDTRFMLQDELRVAGNAGGKFCGQRNGFIEGIGVQALRATQRRRQSFIGGADDVVVRVLLLQRNARGLTMRTQHQAFGLLRFELAHDAVPQQARGAQLAAVEQSPILRNGAEHYARSLERSGEGLVRTAALELERRAPLRPNSYNPETREFTAVISTGADVKRRDSKGSYVERLDLSGINPESLKGKAVILEHRHGDPDAHVGTVVSAQFEGGKLLATIRMTQADSAASARAKVQDGTYSAVSIGYSASAWAERKDREAGTRVRTPVDLTIHEVSLTAIPADQGAVIRSKTDMAKPRKKEDIIEQDDETIIEDNPNDKVQVRTQIRTLVRSAKLPVDFADSLIDMDATLDEARDAISERLQRRSQLASIRVQQVAPSGDDPNVVLTRSTDALAARVMGTAPSDESKPYVNLRLVDHARNILEMRGESVRGERDETILTRAAQHTLSDFPNLLTGTGQRVLRAGYDAAPNVLKSLARKGSCCFRPRRCGGQHLRNRGWRCCQRRGRGPCDRRRLRTAQGGGERLCPWWQGLL